MKKILFITLSVLFLANSIAKAQQISGEENYYVTITTTMGDVTVVLYNDTPLHRDNFVKLCTDGVYDGVLFHRIVKDFVVQGGDPNSKAQEPGVRYGGGDGGYTVPAEIRSHYFNKRGALIDAKQGDDVNVERASAGTQFCFLQGRVLTDEELDRIEIRINDIRKNWLYYKYRKELINRNPELAKNADELDSQAKLMAEVSQEVMGPYVIPEEHRQVYKTIGGAPHLDGSLTIFGEVVEGLDVVEKLSLVETDENDYPIDKVMVISTKVFKK